MDQEQLLFKAGVLANRIGYPVPSVISAQASTDGRYVVLERGATGPVLYVTEDAQEFPDPLLDLVIAQEFVMVGAGLNRHRQLLPVIIGAPVFVLGIVLSLVIGWAWALGIVLVAIPVVWASYEAFWNRRFIRQVDARLAEVLGIESLAEGLRQLAEVRRWRKTFSWLYLGAFPLPLERLSWLQQPANP